ncbi:MAG: hypothetical protein KF833_12950 [Verrucomicrobiae bacterium]|nr:hypothetical protein [Verrucomicrobiae bacterium]
MNAIAALARVAVTVAVTATTVAMIVREVSAQERTGPQVTIEGGFRAPIGDGTRTVAVVSGRDARPSLVAGVMEVTEFRLETFRDDPARTTQLEVTSPLAVFATAGGRGATSDREIHLRSADGRFEVSGQGWSWTQASGMLVVSNRVRTLLRRATGGPDRAPVEVTAGRLEYNLRTGDTRFVGDCLAVDPGEATLRAGQLVSALGLDTDRPQRIEASDEVAIELVRPGRLGRATGARATYVADTPGERIVLSGATTWQYGPGEGAADELELHPGEESYVARGAARLRLQPPVSEGEDTASREPVDVLAEVIEARPGRLVFSGPVTARQGEGLELEAAAMEVLLADDAGASWGAAAVRQLTATGAVRARVPVAGDRLELGGERMVYSVGEHAQIDFTGDPVWRARGYAGRAGRLVIHPEVPAFQAWERVRVHWQPEGSGSDGAGGAGGADGAGGSGAGPIELESERLRVEGRAAWVTGGVTIRRADWELRSSEVELGLGPEGGLREMAAGDGVELDYRMTERPSGGGTEGQPFFATLLREAAAEASLWRMRADRMRAVLAPGTSALASLDADGAVRIGHPALSAEGGGLAYRVEDGTLRLLEGARISMIDGMEIVGQPATALALDLASGRFRVEGPVRRMTLPARSLPGSGTPAEGASRRRR